MKRIEIISCSSSTFLYSKYSTFEDRTLYERLVLLTRLSDRFEMSSSDAKEVLRRDFFLLDFNQY